MFNPDVMPLSHRAELVVLSLKLNTFENTLLLLSALASE